MIFFCKNLAQTKVYGPSLAMIDDWEEHITQLGLTKTVHEYVIYQLLSTAEGWTAWRDFLPGQFADQQLLLTRAIRLIEAANIRPAHARPPHPTWTTAIMQIFRCYHPQGKHLFLKSCFPQLVTTAATSGFKDVNVHGFSAGSYTGLAVHEILSAFAVFPGLTKVAAIATPPEMMRLATGERTVTLVHCLEDRLCVWKPDSLTEFNYQIVLIEGHPTWSGRAKHSYGHLLFIDLDEGVHEVQRLQITTPQVIPHGVRCEGLLRVLSWVSFDLPEQPQDNSKFSVSSSWWREHWTAHSAHWRTGYPGWPAWNGSWTASGPDCDDSHTGRVPWWGRIASSQLTGGIPARLFPTHPHLPPGHGASAIRRLSCRDGSSNIYSLGSV